VSDQKCIYRYLSGAVCGLPKRDWRHDTTSVSHIFQPPLEITDEAVEAAALAVFEETWKPHELGSKVVVKLRSELRTGIEAALRVMQKGQDK